MRKQPTMQESVMHILKKEGPEGFYKGAGVIFIGTIVQRGLVISTYELVYSSSAGNLTAIIPHTGGVQKRTVLSGLCAGMVRSILECPFEYIKVRKMTGQAWQVGNLYKGFATLAPRSTLILTSFFV